MSRAKYWDETTSSWKYVEEFSAGGSGGDTAGVVAPAYDAESTYSEGDLVIQNQLLYEANQDIDEPEAWNPAHWTQRMASEVFARLQPIIVTCLTQDGVTVTGQTVTLRKGSDATAPVYDTAAYEGQPVTFMVVQGFDYFVSVSDTLGGHFAPTTASGIVNGAVSVTLTYNDVSNITTYEGVAAAITALEDPTVMIGDVEIEDTWEADDGTVYDDPMIVVAVKNVEDADGEIHKAAIMQRKWATLNDIPFDAAENEEATETNALEGVYYAALDGSTFTKLSLNAGDPIPYGDHEKILHNGINFDNNMRQYGYNRWGHSFYRKYLNSSGEAGSYEASHVGDVLPSQADTLRGYMAGCSPELLAAAKPIKIDCSLNEVTDGNITETTIDTFWLPSSVEMYGTANSVEGTFFPYWKDATGFSSPSNNANNGRIQYALENHPGARTVWLRSARRIDSCNPWHCYTSGILNNGYNATGAYRACPCFAIY